MQELSKKQQQLEQAHSMLLKPHEKTQELEYRQQKNVHNLRQDQVNLYNLSTAMIIRLLIMLVISLVDS